MNPLRSCEAWKWLLSAACCAALFGTAAIPLLGAEQLRAGVSKVEITPESAVTMSGYESRKGLSEGVHDRLYARAVAFESGGAKLVVVSADVIGFYGGSAEILRQAIFEECDVKPAELFLSAIHTHSGPTVTFDAGRGHSNNVAYSRLLQRKLIEVINGALEGMELAELGFGTGSSPVGVNRRESARDKEGKPRIVLGRNPSIATDREVQVVTVARRPGKEMAAVMFAYPTHSTSLGPANRIISGDIHGLSEQFIERHLGGEVVAPGFAGASGDIDPWYRVLPGFKTANGWVPETVLMGTMLGQEVVHVLERIAKPEASTPVKSLFRTIQLPRKSTANADQAQVSRTAPLNITAGRVGEIAFVGLGGEVFNDIGRVIKADSPFKCTMVITHCNGAAGYLATKSSYAEGGYEVQSSPFEAGAAEVVLREVSQMLAELR
jgi:neutral ceramidase